jgi:hypothetical protein
MSDWMDKLPAVESILEQAWKPISQSPQVITPNRYVREQWEMDLTARTTYSLLTDGFWDSFQQWLVWVKMFEQNKQAEPSVASLLRLSSLQLLKHAWLQAAAKPDGKLYMPIKTILDKDLSIVQIPSQNEFRENLIRYLSKRYRTEGQTAVDAGRLLSVMDLCRGSLDPLEFTEIAIDAVTKLIKIEPKDFKWTRLFLIYTKTDYHSELDFHVRAKIDRLNYHCELIILKLGKRRRMQHVTGSEEDDVLDGNEDLDAQ